MGNCLIISGGDFERIPETIEYGYSIACDKGYEYALKMGIEPDAVIGDFDSYEGDIPEGAICHPVEKDDTDTMLAIKYAMEKGYDSLIICCGLGGRLDHTMANIQSMAYAASHGLQCEMFGKAEYLRIFTGGETIIPRMPGRSLSLFSITDECSGVSIRGSKYDVEKVTFTNDFPLGLGNSWTDDAIHLSMEKGIMLIVSSAMI